MKILQNIQEAKARGKKLLAILIDPDKQMNLDAILEQMRSTPPDMIFVGGSEVSVHDFQQMIQTLHGASIAPVVIFPGDATQIDPSSDALLLLSLISGRNPEYLINQHVKAAKNLQNYAGEIISTSYILIDGGKETSVQRVSQTHPISTLDIEQIENTLIAGAFIGHQLHYLEAGSGAIHHIPSEIIQKATQSSQKPIIVGGGIRQATTAKELWQAGATVVVVGTAFEEDEKILPSFDLAKKSINQALL